MRQSNTPIHLLAAAAVCSLTSPALAHNPPGIDCSGPLPPLECQSHPDNPIPEWPESHHGNCSGNGPGCVPPTACSGTYCPQLYPSADLEILLDAGLVPVSEDDGLTYFDASGVLALPHRSYEGHAVDLLDGLGCMPMAEVDGVISLFCPDLLIAIE